MRLEEQDDRLHRLALEGYAEASTGGEMIAPMRCNRAEIKHRQVELFMALDAALQNAEFGQHERLWESGIACVREIFAIMASAGCARPPTRILKLMILEGQIEPAPDTIYRIWRGPLYIPVTRIVCECRLGLTVSSLVDDTGPPGPDFRTNDPVNLERNKLIDPRGQIVDVWLGTCPRCRAVWWAAKDREIRS